MNPRWVKEALFVCTVVRASGRGMTVGMGALRDLLAEANCQQVSLASCCLSFIIIIVILVLTH